MRRADRLFQIIQVLRRSTRPVTAAALADELEVMSRTVYRDMAELIGQRVPIRGEAGVGYVLDRTFDMPPLMLNADELEVVALGAGWVADRGDSVLARAALDLLMKVAAAVPDHLRPLIDRPGVGVAPGGRAASDGIDMARLRDTIRTEHKLRLLYRDEGGRVSERTVWPVFVGYFETTRLIAAWCEMRGAFRHFRTDRIEGTAFLDERFEGRRGGLRRDWMRRLQGRHGVRPP